MNSTIAFIALLFLLTPALATTSTSANNYTAQIDQNHWLLVDLNQNHGFPPNIGVGPNGTPTIFANNPIVPAENELGVIVEFTDPGIQSYTSQNSALDKSQIKQLNKQYKQDLKAKRLQYLDGMESMVPGSKSKKFQEYDTVLNGVALKLNSAESKKLEKAKLQFIKRIYPNQSMKVLLDQSVPQIGANQVWTALGATGSGVRIAIIDTGVDYTQPELGGCFGTGCKVAGGYDFVYGDADPMDDHGHGTHVAATAAGKAVAGNANTLNGVAPDATIFAYKVLSSSGSGSTATVIAGIERAVDPNDDGDTSDHVDVISMSLGGYGNPDDPGSMAIDAAVDAGVIAVIAAGNSGPGSNTIGSPGTARKAITVAAVDKSNQIAGFSSRGPVQWTDASGILQTLDKPDIAAPGVDICAAQYDGSFAGHNCTPIRVGHVAISGTSMATPHVAGVAALIKQLNPALAPLDVKQLLMDHATLLPYNQYMVGAGLVNALDAANAAKVGILTTSIHVDDIPTQQITAINTTGKIGNFTSNDITFNLSVENANASALTISLGSGTLLVPVNTVSPYPVTFNVNNDLVPSGTTLDGNIVATSVASGITVKTPFSIRVKDRVLIQTKAPELFFGVDNPTLSNWSSPTQDINLVNVRTDVSQTVTFSIDTALTCRHPFPPCSGTPVQGAANVVLLENGSPVGSNQITLSPGQSKSLQLKLTANNALIPNKSYYPTGGNTWGLGAWSGNVLISASQQPNKNLAYSFSKCHAVRFTGPEAATGGWIIDKSTGYKYFGGYYPFTLDGLFCVDQPTTVDIISVFYGVIQTFPGNPPYTVEGPKAFIVNENYSINGDTTIRVDQSDAINVIDFVPRALDNSIVPQYSPLVMFDNRNYPDAVELGICCGFNTMQLRFNQVSSNYLLYYLMQNGSFLFNYDLEGINASKRLENGPNDFNLVKFVFETPYATGQTYPSGLICGKLYCIGGFDSFPAGYNSYNLYVIPFSKNFSPPLPGWELDGLSYDLRDNADPRSQSIASAPVPYFKANGIRRIGQNYVELNQRGLVYPDQSILTEWNIGRKPLFWNGKLLFANGGILPTAKYNVYADYGTASSFGLFRNTGFDVDGYGVVSLLFYGVPIRSVPITYRLLDSSNAVINSGTMQESNYPIPTISLPTPGNYQFEISRDYNVIDNQKVLGQNYTAKATLGFNSTLSDPNAPTFNSMDYLINGSHSSAVNWNRGINQLQFSLDPLGGTIQIASLEFGSSALGIPLQSVPLALNGTQYVGTIPNITNQLGVPADFKITAADSSGNTLVYTFQLPINNDSSIANLGTSTIQGQLQMIVEELQPNGTWQAIQTVYNQPKTIAPNGIVSFRDLFNPATVFVYYGGSYRLRVGLYDSAQQPLTSSTGPLEKIVPFSITGPPKQYAIQASNITATTATISWTTSLPATGTIRMDENIPPIGLTYTFFGGQSPLNQTSFSFDLNQLTTNTVWHFVAKSCLSDPIYNGGVCTTSADLNFKTLPLNSTPQVSGITINSATISWQTSADANALVRYGTTTSYGMQQTSTPFTTGTKSFPLTGLNSGAIYHYAVTSCVQKTQFDKLVAPPPGKNCKTTTDQLFSTVLTVSNIQTTNIGSSNATISWQTSADANALIVYGPTTAYGLQKIDATFAPTHAIGITGLIAGTVYHFAIMACTASRVCNISPDQTFTTYIAAPIISNIQVGNFTSTSATISWNTGSDANELIKYGLTTSYGSQKTNGALSTTHAMDLNGLMELTKYHYQITSCNIGGCNSSTDQLFGTGSFISGISTTTGQTNATIGWNTEKDANGTVWYGLTTAYGQQQNNSTPSKTHSFSISGLTKTTTYHYKIQSCESIGKCHGTTDGTFVTGGGTGIPPNPV